MNLRDIDAAAIAFAKRVEARQPNAKFIGNLLGGLVGDLSGAGYQQNQAETQYNNARDTSNLGYNAAIDQAGNFYKNAEGQIIDATGSPSAATFGALEEAALRPMFKQQNQNLFGQLAANGITASGAGSADAADLASGQSATLAANVAPLYAAAQQAYDQLVSGGAAAQTGLAGQEAGANSTLAGQGAGAGVSAYDQAIQNFYSAIAMAAGAPGAAGGAAQQSGLPSGYTPTSAADAAAANYTPSAPDPNAAGIGAGYLTPAQQSIAGVQPNSTYSTGMFAAPNPAALADPYVNASNGSLGGGQPGQ